MSADQPADAYLLNTCTVTLVADRKARKLVRQLARRRPGAVVAVTGCYAEGVGRAVLEAMPEVELVRGTSDRETLPAAVLLELRRRTALGLLPPLADGQPPAERRVRAMLKVQDGCQHVCRYCIVPAVRGPLRSRALAEVLDQARRLIDDGVRELVLCGIRLGAYGWDWPDRSGSRFTPLLRLVEAVAELPGIVRVRLSSILPLDVGPDLFRLMADLPTVCEHLHLPLQSGDDAVLRAMGRGYRVSRFLELCDRAREVMPDIALATDVMVGYPGETAAQFEATRATCRRAGFADMHIFSYSPRPGTVAAGLPDDVTPAEKQRRSQALTAIRDELAVSFRQRLLGHSAEVLIEEAAAGQSIGLTRNYVRVAVAGEHAPGELVTTRIESVDHDLATGAPAVGTGA